MRIFGLVEKTIKAFDARRQFGKILQEVALGDRYVVERHGKAVAAVVPIEVYRQWKEARNAFFDKLRTVSERTNLSPEEADMVVDQAVKAVRTTKSV